MRALLTAALRACWPLLMIGCGAGETIPGSNAVRPSGSSSREQDVRSGIAALCGSRWNGQVYGNHSVQWLPDELKTAIRNDDVLKLLQSLTSRVRDRVGMFDAFLSANRVEMPLCPFRDRLGQWPSELPVISAEENQPTPPL